MVKCTPRTFLCLPLPTWKFLYVIYKHIILKHYAYLHRGRKMIAITFCRGRSSPASPQYASLNNTELTAYRSTPP